MSATISPIILTPLQETPDVNATKSFAPILLLVISVLCSPANAAEHLRILLTNDDGYESAGIRALHRALKNAGHDVYLIAPAKQQSGASASVTASGVRVTSYPGQVWAVHGKPADAVRVGLGNIMYNQPPHLVVSGANFGQNTGRDVNVSGTVGAAVTAFHLGTPAIAISVELKFEEAARGFPSTAGAFTGAAKALVRLIRNLDLEDMTAVLNMNYPARLPLDVRGVRWTDLSDHSVFSNRYNQQADGLFRPDFQAPHPRARAHDAELLIDGFVTLTFLDGNMETPTRRGQKYLDRNLLHSGDPTQALAPISTSRPEKRPEQAAKVVKKEEIKTKQDKREKREAIVINEQSRPPEELRSPTKLSERKPATSPIQLPKTKQPSEDAILPAAAESEVSKPPQEKPSPVTGNSERGKPDSWLRRMFKPESWQR
ncbi:MAG: 5'-nucleotidase [Candidatus Azotimanducaceae bacterium]|jgi:5'-nucleotidase